MRGVTYLETDRLALRPFTADDAELLIELDSDSAVMRFLSGGEGTPPEVVREQVLPGLLGAYERWDGRFGVFAAEERDGGAFVGWFCLRPDREGPLDVVELGYRLRQAAWGKGYATEGSRALLEKGFTELGVQTVWAATMTVNLPSQRVLDKVGMTVAERIGTPDFMLAVEGSELGGLRYELDREAWAVR